jgi:hypothetical protein
MWSWRWDRTMIPTGVEIFVALEPIDMRYSSDCSESFVT